MSATQGSVRRLADAVKPVPATTVDVSNSPLTTLEGATDVPATLRVWTDTGLWWTTSFAGQSPQWQCTVIVEEQTNGGTSIRTQQLRPRGIALPISGAARYKIGVVLAWIGAGPPPLPSLAGVVLSTTVSPGTPRFHEAPAATVAGSSALFTLTPDLPGESGTFVGRRFCTGVRVSWINGGAFGAPRVQLDGVAYNLPIGWGNIVVNPERELVLIGGGIDATATAEWVIYE